MSITAIPTNTSATSQFVNPSIATAGSADSSFFGMLWDTVNPLQHIPIISEAYRSYMGERINPVSNIAGSTIYGGPIGGAIALASEIGHAIFGSDANTADNKAAVKSTSDIASNNIGTYKMRVTTQDWLKADFEKQAADLVA